MIIIKNIIHNKELKKKSNAVNIVNFMKTEINKDKSTKKFVLDFQDITYVSAIVFQEMFQNMHIRLNGEFVVEIINANPIIVTIYNKVVTESTR